MRFGRSRVQDRARDSDVETVIDDPSAETEPTADFARGPGDAFAHVDAVQDAPPFEPAHFVDSHTITNAEGARTHEAEAAEASAASAADDDADDSEAIDALREATSAADTRTLEVSPEHVVEIYRLHAVTVEAERRAGRILATPSARRRLHDAVTEESDALHMLGFESFDEFAVAHSAAPAVAEHDENDNAETIARIAEILAEIGIDPSGDPLTAAREFLATHEDDLLEPDHETVTPEPGPST